jgi:hypothetical protein
MIHNHWKQIEISVNGISLLYLRTGNESKPPLILANDFSDNGFCCTLNLNETSALG